MRHHPHNRHFQVFVQHDYEEMSRRAARHLHAKVREKPDLLLCAATGGTPTRTYELFAQSWQGHRGEVARLRVIKLDEWGGLPPDDPGTCEAYLRRALLDPLGIGSDRYIGFRADGADPSAECERVGAALDANGPIEICVLGLGVNGHLGFNEPAPALQAHPHVAQLSEASLDHPMVRHARGDVRFGMTLGIGDILHARSVLLLVNGAHKREPLRRLMTGPVATEFPGSMLWLHPDVTCFCDADAAEDL
jgi:galactosamine-6-phosphate isomerase